MILILKYLLYSILFIVSIVIFIALYIGLRNKYDKFYFYRKFSNPSYITYQTPTNQNYLLSDWQSIIKPDIPFNKIVTPGTHDSLTYNWESSLSLIQQYTSYWAETQYLNVNQQLLSGVRYFDARVGICKTRYCDPTQVTVFHGDFSSNTTYESVITDLLDFCDQHPNEIIVWKFRILNNDDEVRTFIKDKSLHSRLNMIPYTSKYYSLSLAELRMMRPDKTKAGIIFTSDYYDSSTNPLVWPTSKIADPYDMAALIIDKKGFTSTGKKNETPTPSPTPLVMKSTMKKIYSDQTFTDDSLTVMQMIAEHQTSTKSSLALSIEKISKRLNEMLFNPKELPPPPKTGYNVIMIDYLTPDHSNAIIQLNQKQAFL